MYPWGDPPTETKHAYAVGDKIRSGANSRGTVVSVDGDRMQVTWDDAEYGPITYPVEAEYLRKVMPWE